MTPGYVSNGRRKALVHTCESTDDLHFSGNYEQKLWLLDDFDEGTTRVLLFEVFTLLQAFIEDFSFVLHIEFGRAGRYHVGVKDKQFFCERIPGRLEDMLALQCGDADENEESETSKARLEQLTLVCWRYAPVLMTVYSKTVATPTAGQLVKLLKMIEFDPLYEYVK